MNPKIVSVKQMREIDRHTIEDIGVPSIVLMENAGRSVAGVIIKKFLRARKIAIFCGGGNNAGDGFVTARYLFRENKLVSIFMLKKPEELSTDAKTNFEIVRNLRVRFFNVSSENLCEVRKKLKQFDLIVDALLGTGTKGEIRGIYADVISMLNSSKRPIVAVDIPSGLDADTGLPLGVCIKAKMTVTMGFMKKGFLKKNAREFTGKVVVADIGLLPLYK